MRRFVLTVTLAICVSAPPASFAHEAHSDSRLVIQRRSKGEFRKGVEGRIRSGSASLDALLAGSRAVDVAPLFPPEGANLELRERLGMDRMFLVRLDQPARIPDLVAELRAHPDVERAEPDYEGSEVGLDLAPSSGALLGGQSLIPNDTYFDRQWAYRNTGSNPIVAPLKPGADIKATDAWTLTRGDPSVLVAVLDSGIKYDHPEFAGRIWSNPGEVPSNGVDDDHNGYVDDIRGWNFMYESNEVLDDRGHGTVVAGILGATGDNALGYAGLDWRATIMPVKILDYNGYGFAAVWAAALYYAANNGARALNMSVAIGYSFALEAAVQYAHDSGCFIAAAMGNTSSEAVLYPAGFSDWVFAVGATDTEDQRVRFSTYGAHIDAVAPGIYIYSLNHLSDTNYDSAYAGTSMSSPMACGLASLLLSQDSTRDPDEITRIIRSTADDEVGSPMADRPGFDIYHGYGRINCYRALATGGIAGSPVVTAPPLVTVREGERLVVEVAAADPESDPIVEISADLSNLPAGHDASFTVDPSITHGTLDWTPDYDDAGSYEVRLSVTSAVRPISVSEPEIFETGSGSFTIAVLNTDRAPTIQTPLAITGSEGLAIQFAVSAEDPDGERIGSLTAAGLPQGAAFTLADVDHGDFTWTPTYVQAGSYDVVFTAANALGTAGTTQITVLDVNRAPVADPGGPYSGSVNAPISFDGSGSSDPDGSSLSFGWDFGDGTTGSGPTPAHAYTLGGTFAATLTVDDGVLTASAAADVSISDVFPATVFPFEGDRTLPLSSAKPAFCVLIQPKEGSFETEAVDFSSIVMISPGTGSVDRIGIWGKDWLSGDRNRDGIEEISACFRKSDVRSLFDLLPEGRHTVEVTLEGDLDTGGRFEGRSELTVITSGALATWLTPNPSRAGSVLTFKTSRAGRVSAKVFDSSGRLVRVLCEEDLPPGYHDLAFPATDGSGRRLASGVYFYRVDSPDGKASGRFAVMR